ENNKHEDNSSLLQPFVHNFYSNATSIPLISTNKDISLDSLDNSQTIQSSTTFSRSETFDKILTTPSLPNIIDNIDDSTSSSSSSS
ncbi:unnamed protein product, partial [Rotaria sp. Silwood1]